MPYNSLDGSAGLSCLLLFFFLVTSWKLSPSESGIESVRSGFLPSVCGFKDILATAAGFCLNVRRECTATPGAASI